MNIPKSQENKLLFFTKNFEILALFIIFPWFLFIYFSGMMLNAVAKQLLNEKKGKEKKHVLFQNCQSNKKNVLYFSNIYK